MNNVAFVIRLSKIVILLTIGGLASMVVFGNVTDYESNFLFVQHIMSMDAKPDDLGKSIEYRAVSSAWMHHLSYVCVILIELVIALSALKGAYDMWKARRASAQDFHNAKVFGIISLTLCCFLWFFGFQVVAGEWFAMWMNSQWNGLSSAFRLVTYMGIALVYLALKNDD